MFALVELGGAFGNTGMFSFDCARSFLTCRVRLCRMLLPGGGPSATSQRNRRIRQLSRVSRSHSESCPNPSRYRWTCLNLRFEPFEMSYCFETSILHHVFLSRLK